MRKIWHTVTPENVFATARRVNRIGAGAKLKPTEEVILKSL